MTFDEYIVNPMGKKNAVMSSITRESIRKDYTTRFNNLLLRENGKINFSLYKEKNNIYYAHVKVPSEVVKEFYYDVVIKFYADKSIKSLGRSLLDYHVEFFSNDPAFVFTYAHTFMKNGLFIKELSSKMSKQAIKTRAKEKNPNDINGYVKSIYFAYLFMKQRGILNPLKYVSDEKFNIDTLLSNIDHADKKIEDRQEEEKKIDKRKKINVDRATARNLKHIGLSSSTQSRLVTSTGQTTKVTRTKSSKGISSQNTIKSTRKTKRS